jgi:hypothetical protein
MGTVEQLDTDTNMNLASIARIEKVADYIKRICMEHELAVDPAEIDRQVAEIKKNSTMPPPADVRKVAAKTLRSKANNIERDMYMQEFPGHSVPDHLN